MTDKLVSSFTGATTDLVTQEVSYLVLNYIKSQWDDNFDWSGSGAKPMTPAASINWFSWWNGAGPLSIAATNVYTSSEPVEIGFNGMIESRSDIRLDLFARQRKTVTPSVIYNYPVNLYSAGRFIRNLVAINPEALTSVGIHEWRVESYRDIPEQKPAESIFHYQITIRLIYMHNVRNL